MIQLRSTRDSRRKKFSKTSKPTNPRNRLLGILAFFMVIGIAFIAVLVDLQAVRADRFRDLGIDQRIASASIEPVRGNILDSGGFVLAASRPSHDLVLDPSLIIEKDRVAAELAERLNIDPDEMTEFVNGSGPEDRYELVAENIPTEVVEWFAEATSSSRRSDWQGVYVRASDRRTYPGGSIGLGIVGRVDTAQSGVFGIESGLDEVMRGVPGSSEFERNNFGGQISVGSATLTPAQSGFDVVLTVDHRLQYDTERIIAEVCDERSAAGVSAIVSDVQSGQILAMASVSEGEDGCEVARYNKPLVDTYEPGSVLKPFVFAGAFENLGYTADTVVNIDSSIEISDKEFFDTPRQASRQSTVAGVLAESSNVGTITLASRIGPQAVYNALTDLGVGSKPQLGIGVESSGTLREVSEWYGSDLGSIAIGQGVATTLMQVHTGYSIIANGGTYVEPRIVDHLRSPEGRDLLPEPSERSQVLDPAVANEVAAALTEVVANGTGQNASVNGVQAAGKTGTAWKVFEDESGNVGYGTPDSRRYVASFSGFAPANDPKFVVSVVVDEPKEEFRASQTAAPAFSQIMSSALRLYEYELDQPTPNQGQRVIAQAATEQFIEAEEIEESQDEQPQAAVVDVGLVAEEVSP